jgi:cysteine desulfurase/selenocysteine lyase
MLNIEKLRHDTPGCSQVLHFNNAGAALMPAPVVTAMKQHLDLEATCGGYEAATMVLTQSERIYAAAARLINCSPDEIAFVENATRAWEMAFYSLAFAKGDRILTAQNEYASNYLAFLQVAKKTGAVIEVIPNDAYGQLDVEYLRNTVDRRVKLIAITHVPTQGGLINPAEAVGKIAREQGILYLLDTTQSIGQMPIDVEQIGCDFLCATGRKYLRGPRGTGFLYVRKNLIAQCEPPVIDLQSATWIDEHTYQLKPTALRFETWEQNIAAKIGLGVAIDYAYELGLPAIWERIQLLAQCLRRQLAQIASITLHDLGQHTCGIVTLTSARKSVQEIQRELSVRKMNVSVSLQEYAWLDMASRHLPALLRVSVHYYNTEDEVDLFCRAIEAIVNRPSP